MKTSILTIAIPTYNHNEGLIIQLDRLLPQINDLVELIILDNHSIPPVESVLSEYLINYPQIKLVRNTTNIGGDANICRCFEYCQTEWLWILSDNDFINAHATEMVLKLINEHSDCIFINFKSKNNHSTIGFKDFCYNSNSYSNLFHISICLYNVSILSNYLIYYYENLSSKQGQLILLLKYLESNNGKCFFSSYNIIEKETPATWSKYKYSQNIVLLFKSIDRRFRKVFKRTIGKKVVSSQCRYVAFSRYTEKIKRTEQLKTIFQLMIEIGFFPFISKSNLKSIIFNILAFIAPQRIKKYIK